MFLVPIRDPSLNPESGYVLNIDRDIKQTTQAKHMVTKNKTKKKGGCSKESNMITYDQMSLVFIILVLLIPSH